MADIDISVKKKKATDLTWVWAVAAILAVAGLMGWLYTNQQTTTEVMTASRTDTVADAPAAGAVETVELTTLGAAPDQYVDRVVQIQNVPVTSVLGNRTFWADVPGANPLLVNVGPAVADASWVTPNSTATLQGTVQPVTEAEVDRWVQGGALLDEARVQATFATHYFQVAQVQR